MGQLICEVCYRVGVLLVGVSSRGLLPCVVEVGKRWILDPTHRTAEKATGRKREVAKPGKKGGGYLRK